MKPHILLTIEELRAHAHLLQDMIQALEAYGRCTPAATEDPPAAPAQPVPSSPTQAAVARVSAAPKRRPPSGGKGVRQLVEQVAQTLGAFKTAELKSYIRKHHGNLASKIGASSYGSALNTLAHRGQVSKTDTGWQWVGAGTLISAKEAEYRKFREQVTTPSNAD